MYELSYELEMAPDHSSVLIHIYTSEINVRSFPHKVRYCTKAKSQWALYVGVQKTAYRLFFVPYKNLSSPHFWLNLQRDQFPISRSGPAEMMNESAGVWRVLLQTGELQRVITEEES
jgi:hypothetical protein